MSAKQYKPLEHSVVQGFMKADGWNRYEVQRHGYVHALLNEIVSRLDTAYWNAKQEQFKDRKDREFLEIPGFEYRRYYWDDCDCGADSPVHAKECRQVAEHEEWNDRRIDAISDPSEYSRLTSEQKTELEPFEALMKCSRLVHFDRSESWEKNNPRPPCTCGATAAWKPRDHHLPTCSPQQPNLKFGEVIVNWYKYLGRGTSTNVDWTEREWRVWFDDVIAAISEWDEITLERIRPRPTTTPR